MTLCALSVVKPPGYKLSVGCSDKWKKHHGTVAQHIWLWWIETWLKIFKIPLKSIFVSLYRATLEYEGLGACTERNLDKIKLEEQTISMYSINTSVWSMHSYALTVFFFLFCSSQKGGVVQGHPGAPSLAVWTNPKHISTHITHLHAQKKHVKMGNFVSFLHTHCTQDDVFTQSHTETLWTNSFEILQQWTFLTPYRKPALKNQTCFHNLTSPF